MLKDKLRQARKNAGFTQLQVAKAIGVTESTYCGYETGKRQPDPIKISAIASFLGVSGDFLLDINIPENEKNPAPESGLSEARRALLDAVEGMSEEEILHLLDVIAAVKGMRK